MQLQIALQGCKLLKVRVIVVVVVVVGESEGRGAAAGLLQAAQDVDTIPTIMDCGGGDS